VNRPLSRRLLLARARLGLPACTPSGSATSAPIDRAHTLARQLLDHAHKAADQHAGHLTFVTGPSGGGKSLTLRAWSSLQTRLGFIILSPSLPPGRSRTSRTMGCAVIDALGSGTIQERLDALSAAGLADATILDRPTHTLSEGQRFRLSLARLMREASAARLARQRFALAIDEFGSLLDRTTAAAIARTFSRWRHRQGLCALVASAHDDLLEALAPDVTAIVDLAGRCQVIHSDAPAHAIGSA
jgi:uncharacterized protein